MLLSIMFSLAFGQQVSPGYDARARIEAALAVVQPVAYRSRQVDWAELQEEMGRASAGARDDIDMLPAWAMLAQGLGDGHSFVQPARPALAGWRERHGEKPYNVAVTTRTRPRSPYTDRSGVEGRSLPVTEGRDARILTVPSVSGLGEDATRYASELFAATASAEPKNCGFILDLRGNTGGNVWPMLLGLSGLLGDGPQGRTEDSAGVIEDYAALREGAVVVLAERGRGLTMMSITDWLAKPRLVDTPVALLLDDATASSGEGVAVAFAGRKNTKTFGQPTYGAASSNEGFELADGTNMVITTAMMMDRQGRTYPKGLVPDQAVDGIGEEPILAAQSWLAEQPNCASASS